MIVCKPKSALINTLFALAAVGLGIWLYLILTFDLHANFWLQLGGIWLTLFLSILIAVVALRKYFILRADRSGIEVEYRFPKRRSMKLFWPALKSWQEISAGKNGTYKQLQLNFGNHKINIANLEHSNYVDLLTWLQKNATNKRK
ncbi:hypothetical protein [Rhodoflexus sp.]